MRKINSAINTILKIIYQYEGRKYNLIKLDSGEKIDYNIHQIKVTIADSNSKVLPLYHLGQSSLISEKYEINFVTSIWIVISKKSYKIFRILTLCLVFNKQWNGNIAVDQNLSS